MLRLAGENPLKTLRRAVQTMVARLDYNLRRFCWMIMNGLSLHEIALALHIRWHEVRKRVAQIRQQLIGMGLETIIDWREMNRA